MGCALLFNCWGNIIKKANYGGRVTDSNDRRLLNVILRRYFNSNLIKD
jgi:hypothetical protein